MRYILSNLCCIGVLVGLSSFASAADQKWKGQISDSMCGPSHVKTLAAHPLPRSTHRACTKACMKAGAKYVFVTEGKVYPIVNQDFPTLRLQAGHTVELTGEMKGDTVTVSKMTLPGRQVRVPAKVS